jgi:hypothetical protein
MRNNPDEQGDQRQDGPAEPPAELLRRALSHVEDLLGRLEYPAVKQDELPDLGDEQAQFDVVDPEPLAARPELAAPGPDRVSADADMSAVPGRSVEEELLLQQARDTAKLVEEDAGATADAILGQARRDAQLIRAQGQADAEQLLQEAALEAEQTLADAEIRVRQRLAVDGAGLSPAAGGLARAGTAAPLDAEASVAAADFRTAADADRAQAREMLDAARSVLAGLRTDVRRVREAVTLSVGSIESAERAIDALLKGAAGGGQESPPPEGGADLLRDEGSDRGPLLTRSGEPSPATPLGDSADGVRSAAPMR